MIQSKMDYYFKFTKIKYDMQKILICIFVAICIVGSSVFAQGYGFDGGSQCNPKNGRRGRAQLLATIPCDLTIQAYCNLPGTLYPWHAVRRFVHENQGLMKRMYGDVRHISVLRTEINNNDIELEDIEKTAIRYSRTNWKKNKYLYQSEYSKHGGTNNNNNNNNNDVLSEPHFRIASSSSSTLKSKTNNHHPSSLSINKLSNSNSNSNNNNNNSTIQLLLEPTDDHDDASSLNSILNKNDNNLENLSIITTGNDEEIINSNEDGDLLINNVSSPSSSISSSSASSSSSSSSSSSIDVQYNSIYENVTEKHHDNENIKIINPPNLNSDIEKPVTLSTTLKIIPTRINNRTSPATTISSDGTNIKTTMTTTTVLPPSSTITNSDSSETNVDDTLKSIDRIDDGNNNNNNRDDFGESNSESGISTSSDGSSFDNYESYISEVGDSRPSSNINSNGEDIIKMQSIPKVNTKITAANIKDIHPKQATKFNLRPTINNNNNNNNPNNPNTQHMEGQLFQDVVPKDSPAIMNSRGVNACPVKEEVVAPFWANNTRGEVLALLNLYPFEQYVHWEKCTNEHKQMYCRDGCRCEQQYRLHRLLAYDPHNECRGIFSDWFRFPSCCICKCYDIPIDYRVTSRSPRSVIDHAEETVKNAIYEHATEDWYRHSNKYRALNDIGDHNGEDDDDDEEYNIDEEIDDEQLFL